MSEDRKKPSPEEVVRQVLGDEGDDDAREIANMTQEEVERELVRGGFDLARVRADTERQLAQIERAIEKAEARAPVVPIPRRRVLRWSLLAAALVAAALAAIPAVEMFAENSAAPDRRDKAPREVQVARAPEERGTAIKGVPVAPAPGSDAGEQ
jgi:hypothetical protein